VHFFVAIFSIVFIDLLLAGDNALVIAMAVKSLSGRERHIGLACGAGAAVLLRVTLTLMAARLLAVPYLQLAGGVLVIWIAVKVLRDANDPPDAAPSPKRFWQAIWYIALADLTMSTDNILAIAGASKGNLYLILFGLALSIPFVVLSSNLLADVMDRYPATIYLGAGILGKVGGDMILTDPAVVGAVSLSTTARYGLEAVLAFGLMAAGWMMSRAETQ
jgi:YjbE family integral membrane protein